ncbi:hypothetical protein [Taibaiella chishuiensis]|uniref:Uncharacterized protein n=1 Tax=Taibaiella chishuiensis TaxID=1434707 RepID=A0A2P8D7G1_9BACT|nr:hypothetical protein [Taibaiella chishuiensis]PSK93148.1 hypothetical protein B0I18_102118 [Taibaiella chishuiensis]
MKIPEYYFLLKMQLTLDTLLINKRKLTMHLVLMSDFRYDIIDLYGNNFDEFIETLDHEYE